MSPSGGRERERNILGRSDGMEGARDQIIVFLVVEFIVKSEAVIEVVKVIVGHDCFLGGSSYFGEEDGKVGWGGVEWVGEEGTLGTGDNITLAKDKKKKKMSDAWCLL